MSLTKVPYEVSTGLAKTDLSNVVAATGRTALSVDSSAEVTAKVNAISTDLLSDTTPQLGGALDANSNTFNASSYRQITDVSVASGTHTFNYANGDMQQLTVTGNCTVAFSNMPTGQVVSFIIDAINWGAFTVTLPVGMLFEAATAPAFTAAGTDRLVVLKDKDDVYSMFVVGQAVA